MKTASFKQLVCYYGAITLQNADLLPGETLNTQDAEEAQMESLQQYKFFSHLNGQAFEANHGLGCFLAGDGGQKNGHIHSSMC